MNPFASEIASVTAQAQLSTIVQLAEKVPLAALALLVVVLLAVYGLVRFDLENHLPAAR
jgi:hypothetical protein